MRKFKIFYSWQSDLPGNKTRNFIRDCIDEAIDLAEESEAIEAERDEATKDTTGAPNIVTTLFSKIDECDLFIADVSLCFTSNTPEEKKSPNPNVLLELGYAVKTLGWERVICLCNTDFGKEYPFDIAHNRITNFSLEGKSKKEVKSDISKVIFFDIRALRKAQPRAKVGEAAHILGTYDFSEHIVKEVIAPINLSQREGYLLHNKELLEEAKTLFAEIKNFKLPVVSVTSSEPDTSTSSEPIAVSIKSPGLDAVSKMFQNIETPAEWKDAQSDAKLVREWLKIDVPEDFFYLGNLRYVTPGFNPLHSAPTLTGTDAEKEKYKKLRKLSRILTLLEVRSGYLRTFDNMLFIPVAIQNISKLQDDNISVILKIETGDIVEPSENLIWSEYEGIQGMFCRDDDDKNDVGIICELFCLDEDGGITIENSPYNPALYTARMPIPTANGFRYPAKSEKDYVLELKEFIATANGRDYYEFDVSNLRPNECKWLCCGLLIKPVDNAVKITYHIRSAHSAGDLGGTLEYFID